jgi:hypothetical protein
VTPPPCEPPIGKPTIVEIENTGDWLSPAVDLGGHFFLWLMQILKAVAMGGVAAISFVLLEKAQPNHKA